MAVRSPKGKPDPEIYLLAAERLELKVNTAPAFEDSNMVFVGKVVTAQMLTFQIPDLVEPCDEIRSFGHNIFPSLLDVMDYLESTDMWTKIEFFYTPKYLDQ